MILLINPRPTPQGYSHSDGYSPVRVLMSTRQVSKPAIVTRGAQSPYPATDLYEAIWPWVDVGAAKRYIFTDGQYRMNLRFGVLPFIGVGSTVWLAVIGAPSGEQAGWMDGEWRVIALDEFHLELAP